MRNGIIAQGIELDYWIMLSATWNYISPRRSVLSPGSVRPAPLHGFHVDPLEGEKVNLLCEICRRVLQRICGQNKNGFFASQPRHGFEKKPLTLPSPPGEGILSPLASWGRVASVASGFPGEGILVPIASWSYAALT